MIVKRIIISLVFLLSVLVVSTLVYWAIAPKSSSSPKDETKSASQHAPTQSVKKPTKSKTSAETLSPPPPDVKWSEFSRQLLGLEQERVAIFEFLSEKFPPPEIELLPLSQEEDKSENTNFSTLKTAQSVDTVTPSPVTINFAEVSWSTVGKQVVNLEQQREQTITLLVEELIKASSTPTQFEKIK